MSFRNEVYGHVGWRIIVLLKICPFVTGFTYSICSNFAATNLSAVLNGQIALTEPAWLYDTNSYKDKI